MTANNKLLLYSLFLSILILMWAPKGKADEIMLATIATDVDSDTYAIVVDVDNDSQVLKSFFIDNFTGGKKVKRDALPIETFVKEGLSVKNNSPITFAKIESENFLPDLGGPIRIDALYNALTGRRKQYELELAKDKSTWRLFSHGKIITKIFAQANRVPVIGVVGAKDLIMQ